MHARSSRTVNDTNEFLIDALVIHTNTIVVAHRSIKKRTFIEYLTCQYLLAFLWVVVQ
jgi:hypothetical protein